MAQPPQQQQQQQQQQQWVQDISIETTTQLTTTGGSVWSAARRCLAYLEAEAVALGLTRPGIRILELGAGCGLLGMCVARNLPAAGEVCLTEQVQGGALAHLQRNVAANAHLLPRCTTTAACDWSWLLDVAVAAALQAPASGGGDGGAAQQQPPQAAQAGTAAATAATAAAATGAGAAAAAPAGLPPCEQLADMRRLLLARWDVIIGSDLVYNEVGVKALPRLLAALMPLEQGTSGGGGGGFSCTACCGSVEQAGAAGVPAAVQAAAPGRACCMYYAHTKGRFEAYDIQLLQELEAAGLEVHEVLEATAAAAARPASPPPFSSLFPEMRCVVWRIRRPQQCCCCNAAQ